jgi:hypothetical protein
MAFQCNKNFNAKTQGCKERKKLYLKLLCPLRLGALALKIFALTPSWRRDDVPMPMECLGDGLFA